MVLLKKLITLHSIDSIEIYAYGTGKDAVREKEEIKCNSIIRQYEKLLPLIMLQKKT